MIVDYMGAKNQQEQMQLGMKLQQAGFEANQKELQAQVAEESLNDMKKLRQTLGTQIAMNAAAGRKTGAGSALLSFNESISAFNADERIRKMNVLGKNNQLKANMAISRLQNSSDISKLWQGFGGRTINRFPSSYSGWQQANKDMQEGFGLTKVGS